jgi:hypothetical protein
MLSDRKRTILCLSERNRSVEYVCKCDKPVNRTVLLSCTNVVQPQTDLFSPNAFRWAISLFTIFDADYREHIHLLLLPCLHFCLVSERKWRSIVCVSWFQHWCTDIVESQALFSRLVSHSSQLFFFRSLLSKNSDTRGVLCLLLMCVCVCVRARTDCNICRRHWQFSNGFRLISSS